MIGHPPVDTREPPSSYVHKKCTTATSLIYDHSAAFSAKSYDQSSAVSYDRNFAVNTYGRERGTTERRAPHWQLESLRRFRHRVIQRAGRLTRPSGKLTLTMNANQALRIELTHLLDAQIAA